MGVPQHVGFIRENPFKMDDLGVPPWPWKPTYLVSIWHTARTHSHRHRHQYLSQIIQPSSNANALRSSNAMEDPPFKITVRSWFHH